MLFDYHGMIAKIKMTHHFLAGATVSHRDLLTIIIMALFDYYLKKKLLGGAVTARVTIGRCQVPAGPGPLAGRPTRIKNVVCSCAVFVALRRCAILYSCDETHHKDFCSKPPGYNAVEEERSFFGCGDFNRASCRKCRNISVFQPTGSSTRFYFTGALDRSGLFIHSFGVKSLNQIHTNSLLMVPYAADWNKLA